MTDTEREKAMSPEDIPRLFLAFVQDGDFAGLATLYEPGAVLALPPGQVTTGNTAIAAVFEQLLAGQSFDPAASEQRPVLRSGDFALTSTRLPDGRTTAEVAHRQPDGSWRWVVDQPNA